MYREAEKRIVKKMNEDKKINAVKQSPLFINLLSGKFLSNPTWRKNLPFLGFLYVLILLYIGLGYYAEGMVKKINKGEGEIKELRSEFISIKSELVQKSKQSEVARMLEEKATGIKETIIPPKKIVVKKND